jgi:hypothetical protein
MELVMKKMIMVGMAACSLMLSACTNMGQSPANVAMAKNKVLFQLPASQKWELVSVEQDANGYAKSYRSMSAKGSSADQSFYINYGRNIRTPLLEAMHEVVGSMASTGCKHTGAKMIKLEKSFLIFSASADQCITGRSISQVFKVFNMEDGQYSIVYSANPHAVKNKIRAGMESVVIDSRIAPL